MTFSRPDLAEITQSTERIYEGKVINLRKDTVTQPDGAVRTREVVEHPGGVTVFATLDDGRILFVEQFRYALGQVMLELPAGKLEPGEDPDEAIKRELIEETGYQAKHWEKITEIIPAPGFCNEIIRLYKASGLEKIGEATGDGEEFLNCLALTPEEAFEKIRNGEIIDAKTITLLCLADRL